jgi:hypothetical protein
MEIDCELEPSCDTELGALREVLDSQVKEWTHLAYAKLSAAKEARKQSEHDAQLIANRIALLKDEERKAWRQIENTRKQTDAIAEKRRQLEERFCLQEQARQSRLEKENEQRRINADMRARSQSIKREVASAIQNKRVRSARASRAESQEITRRRADAQVHTIKAGTKSAQVLLDRPPLRSASACEPRLEDVADEAASLEQEVKELMGRMRFASSAGGRRPPRPAIEDVSADSNTSAKLRPRCGFAQLTLARESFADGARAVKTTPPNQLSARSSRNSSPRHNDVS